MGFRGVTLLLGFAGAVDEPVPFGADLGCDGLGLLCGAGDVGVALFRGDEHAPPQRPAEQDGDEGDRPEAGYQPAGDAGLERVSGVMSDGPGAR